MRAISSCSSARRRASRAASRICSRSTSVLLDILPRDDLRLPHLTVGVDALGPLRGRARSCRSSSATSIACFCSILRISRVFCDAMRSVVDGKLDLDTLALNRVAALEFGGLQRLAAGDLERASSTAPTAIRSPAMVFSCPMRAASTASRALDLCLVHRLIASDLAAADLLVASNAIGLDLLVLRDARLLDDEPRVDLGPLQSFVADDFELAGLAVGRDRFGRRPLLLRDAGRPGRPRELRSRPVRWRGGARSPDSGSPAGSRSG